MSTQNDTSDTKIDTFSKKVTAHFKNMRRLKIMEGLLLMKRISTSVGIVLVDINFYFLPTTIFYFFYFVFLQNDFEMQFG